MGLLTGHRLKSWKMQKLEHAAGKDIQNILKQALLIGRTQAGAAKYIQERYGIHCTEWTVHRWCQALGVIKSRAAIFPSDLRAQRARNQRAAQAALKARKREEEQ